MNEQERLELDRLKRLHELLQQQLNELGSQMNQLQTGISQQKPSSLEEPQPMEIPPLPISSLGSTDDTHVLASQTKPAQPPVLPAVPVPETVSSIPPIISQTNLPETLLRQRTQFPSAEQQLPTNDAVPPKFNEPPPIEGAKGSFEMRLGTYWLVRVGIVLLLTGMVFFARYAYQNYFGHLGPLGKVILMYVGSGLLLGTGMFLQRKQNKVSLQNYGQVLFAGGLALVYFITYAAHHIANLRVIPNPVIDGALLLAWTAFIVWIADRKKSEVLALFAIGLAYYTSIITTIGLFTLYSNLVLTVAAVFFLLRNRWTRLSFASLVATYVAFVFWRFHSGEGWLWSWRVEELWTGNWFLAGYWIVFTASTFLSRAEENAQNFRVPFLTLNNAAFFGLVVLSMFRIQHGYFWKFSIGFGAVLLGLALLAKRFLPKEADVKNGYLTQGLLLVTLGIISYFSGLRLALVLATESTVLFILGTSRKNLFLQAGAYVTAFLATLWGFSGMAQSPEILPGAAVGGLLLFNAFWAHRNAPPTEGQSVFRPQPAYFISLALAIWMMTMWQNCSRENLPMLLAFEALLFAISIYLLRMPELPLLGQSYLIFAQFLWLAEYAFKSSRSPWWSPAAIIAVTIALSHWWQRQKLLTFAKDIQNVLVGIYSLAVIGVIFFWLKPIFSPEVWIALTCLFAITLTIYGIVTRLWLMAAAAQLFVLFSIGSFQMQLNSGNLPWYLALTPVATLLLLGIIFTKRAPLLPGATDSVQLFTAVYRWIALLMSLAWVHEYIPRQEQFWILMLLGMALFFLAAKLQKPETFLFSSILFVVGIGIFLLRAAHRETILHWPNFVALLVLPVLQQLAKRHSERFPVINRDIHAAVIGVSCITLWIYISRLVTLTSAGKHLFLTASWGGLALALFVTGLLLKERVYRWCGLAILGVAVARVFLFDVWKLETVYRILSFMALGLVLLVLGFLYNKYQEKIKDWI